MQVVLAASNLERRHRLDARNASPVVAVGPPARRCTGEISENTRARARRTSAAQGAHRIQG
jgi:hypothetical protein